MEATIYLFLYLSLFFEVFMLLVFIEKRHEILQPRPKKTLRGHMPFATILVPVFNEEKTIGRTIASLLDLDYPKDRYEVIAIDDGSTDKSREKLLEFAKEKRVRVLFKENGGKHTALNYGLQFAQGSIIGCLDGDSFVAKDALRAIALQFQEKKVMAVIPSIRVDDPRTSLQYLQTVEYSLNIFIRKTLALLGSIFITPGPFSFFRKEVFATIGSWKHGHNTEDLEICLRMQAAHMKIVNAHEAIVFTTAPPNLRDLYMQRVRWTYGFLSNMKDHYREFLFRREHGNLGLFVLPLAFISVYSVIYLAISFVWSMGKELYRIADTVFITGWHFSLSGITLDWFFLHTSEQLWIGIVMLTLLLGMIAIGMSISREKFHISKGLFYYGTLYALLVPFWLASAALKVLLSHKPSWR